MSYFDSPFAESIYNARYKHPEDGDWAGTAARVTGAVLGALDPFLGSSTTPYQWAAARLRDDVRDLRFIPGGRYLYAAGRDLHQVNNCILLLAEDTREGWADLSYKAEMALMTGAGIGVWYGDLREAGAPIRRTGGEASGPLGKMKMVNDMGRYVMQGGARRSAIWAGLPWWHQDVLDFIVVKDYSDEVKALKEKDWTFPAPMDTTNISVTLDDEFFAAYSDPSDPRHEWAHLVYWTALDHMLRHGEPGFTVDTGEHAGEVLRNACTEITSADDSDVCNLGSLVMPRFDSPKEFGRAVRDAVLFLTAGSVYSHVPYEGVAETRDKNRRLGLGLIGVHEFVMKHGAKYGTDDAFEVLDPYMREYDRALEYAWDWQDALCLSRSKAVKAIAPNGTIGILAGSTPSADPMFAAAERRQVKMANVHGPDRYEEHIVVDPVAKRLAESGVPLEVIEDAHTLAREPERRLAQQAYLQQYVDHSISSTVNLPAPVTDALEQRQLGDTLLEYLPNLRGVTFYPDGARAGQPRTPVDLADALREQDAVEAVDEGRCQDGVCAL